MISSGITDFRWWVPSIPQVITTAFENLVVVSSSGIAKLQTVAIVISFYEVAEHGDGHFLTDYNVS